jgi:hypothetical protein
MEINIKEEEKNNADTQFFPLFSIILLYTSHSSPSFLYINYLFSAVFFPPKEKSTTTPPPP